MTATTMTETAPDYDEIVRVVQLYVDAHGKGDPSMFAEAFHPDAWIFCILPDGSPFIGRLADHYPDWANPPDPRVVGRIISVTQAGEVASVVLGFDDPAGPDDSWLDLHNLMRIDGVWKITNKTATHSSRSGGVWQS